MRRHQLNQPTLMMMMRTWQLCVLKLTDVYDGTFLKYNFGATSATYKRVATRCRFNG